MPSCPKCHKEMTPKPKLGFWFLVQYIIDVITSAGVKAAKIEFGCKNMVPNPKYAEWVALKNKGESNLPPPPPEKIPCQNHWNLKASGRFNEHVVRRKQNFYYADGRKVEKLL